MARELTKKQKGFIKDYAATGNGKIAIQRNYARKGVIPGDKTARVMASENLAKPSIITAIKSIADSLPDELLVKRHLELLNKRERGNKPETFAVMKGLEMAYKLKGSFAPEKSINVNVDLLREEIESKIKEFRAE